MDMHSLGDCLADTLDSVDDVDELLSRLLFMPSMVVLTRDGKLWEVFADHEEETLVLNELDGYGQRRLEFESFREAHKVLAGGWVIRRR